jgi:hypothetical protein
VRASGRPVTVKELAQEVVRARFPTASRDIPQLVKNKVAELVKRGVFRRADGQPGVVLASPQGGPPARPARAAAGGKKAASKGTAAPKPAPATETTAKRGKESLAALLIRLLGESQRPLKAKELAERALAAGYETQSKDFTNVVWVALGKTDGIENVAGEGYRLKGRPARTK